MHEAKVLDIIVLDSSKVFDAVPHSTLLDRLSNGDMNSYMLLDEVA